MLKVHIPLHSNCDLRILSKKINAHFFYPPSYDRKIRQYSEVDKEIFKKTGHKSLHER